MQRPRLRRWSGYLGLIVFPVAVLLGLRANPRFDVLYRDVTFHLIVVTSIAACALLVALAATRAALRSAQPGPVWLAVGCVTLGFCMFGHGLLTPGIGGRGYNQWVGRLPYIAITAFAVSLVIASRPRNSIVGRIAVAHPGVVLATPIVVLTALIVKLGTNSHWMHGDYPLSWEDEAKTALMYINLALLLYTSSLHYRRWRLGYDPVQFSLVLAGVMSGGAMLSLELGQLWRISWWDYHAFLLAGFSGAVYAVWLRFKRTREVDRVLAAVFDTDPMIHIVEGFPESLRKLVKAVETKDSYTHGHSERTAQVAVQLALRIGVDDATLQAVARGAYLHDVGKISIPDEVLNKPGALTDDERRVMQGHPQLGHDIVATVAELQESLGAILNHHERWDGTGYPNSVAAENIPLVARIVAVADVWDALTSDRAYRPGVAPEQALAHIAAGSGAHFDPALVTAFVSLAADWGYQPRGDGDVDNVVRAVEKCHELTANRA